MTDADYDYILDEIEHCKKLILKVMRVLIAMRNSIDDKTPWLCLVHILL